MTPEINNLFARLVDIHTAYTAAKQVAKELGDIPGMDGAKIDTARAEAYDLLFVGEDIMSELDALVWERLDDNREQFARIVPKELIEAFINCNFYDADYR